MFRGISSLDPTDELLTIEDLSAQTNIPEWVIEAWVTVGSLDLRRVVYSELHGGVLLCSRADTEKAGARFLNKRSTKSFSPLPMYDDGLVDKDGEPWRTLKWTCNLVG